MAKSDEKEPITIKKYANRRLYNTATSKYVTLDDLSQMVKAGEEFVVVDAKSGDDITRPVLTQIIFEEESKGPKLAQEQFNVHVIAANEDQQRQPNRKFKLVSQESYEHMDQLRREEEEQ